MARLPNFLVIIRSEKLSGKGQGRGCLGVRKKERFVLGKRTFRSQKSKHFVLRIIQEEIGILNRKILCLIAENKRVCENSSVDALFVLEELKQGNLIISNMTIAERQHIFDFLDLVHANFITRLKQEFDLTKNELLLAALLKVGFSNKQLMIVFDCEMKSIYKNRQRLKADLGLTKNDSLEQMIMMY